MKLQKRKTFVPIVGMLCAGLFSTVLSADQHQKSTQRHSYGQSHSSHSGEYQRDSHRMITPQAGPKTSGGMDFFISADYIYWRASLDHAGIFATGNPLPNQTTVGVNAAEGSFWPSLYGWGSGFKVALGGITSHDGFDIKAEYTWNRFKHQSTFNEREDENLYALGGLIAQPYNQTYARFSYNKVDLELGRDFHLSPKLTLRPHAGLTGIWQSTIHSIKGDNGATGDLNVYDYPGNTHLKAQIKAWGLGPRLGFDFFWMFIKEFGIYSGLTSNAIWGSFYDISAVYSAYNNETNETTLVRSTHRDDFNQVCWVTEFEMGLRYQTLFSEDRYRFLCQIGWETQTWINWYAAPTNGDLSFQGLDVKLRFDF